MVNYNKLHAYFYSFKWKDINPDQLMDSKLKCVFENPVTSTTVTAKTTVSSTVTKTDSVATNGKNKAVGDSVKSSPKVGYIKILCNNIFSSKFV
jgi:hypothetical protein